MTCCGLSFPDYAGVPDMILQKFLCMRRTIRGVDMSHSVLPCAWTGAWSADCSDNFILLARDNYFRCVQKHNRGLNPKGISSLGDRQGLQLNGDGGYTPLVIGTDFAAGTTRPPQHLHLMIEVSSSKLIVFRQDHAIRPHESSALWFVEWVAIEGVNPAP